MPGSRREDRIDHAQAAQSLDELWLDVAAKAEQNPAIQFVTTAAMREAIHACVNHAQVGYRFCLPIQLLGKHMNGALDSLALQRKTGEMTWDARSLGSKVVAPFNTRQENVLGTSSDPYVGNAMRIPRMVRNDPSKRDVAGWNTLLDVLETVELQGDPKFTENVLRQVLLEIHRRQQQLRFTYSVPPRVSLKTVLGVAKRFLAERSGGDRALALAGALFDVIAAYFGLFAEVKRARINASDESSGQAADLECVNSDGAIVLAVEVKDRALKLADVEGTITKTRHREIREVFFTAPKVEPAEAAQIDSRIETAFAGGQSLYVADFFELARAVLALGGEKIRKDFLRRVGEHLDAYNTQPSHRQAWKRLLESI